MRDWVFWFKPCCSSCEQTLWEECQQWALSFQHCLIFRVNNKHWNSKELLGLVVVSAGKPITLQLQGSFRLRHLLNWVQGAGRTKRCVLLLLHTGAFLRVLQQSREHGEKTFPSKHQPPSLSDIRQNRKSYRDWRRFEMSFSHRCRMETRSAAFDKCVPKVTHATGASIAIRLVQCIIQCLWWWICTAPLRQLWSPWNVSWMLFGNATEPRHRVAPPAPVPPVSRAELQ